MAATPCVGRHAGLDSGTYKTLVSLVTGVCRCLISCVHSTSISTVIMPISPWNTHHYHIHILYMFHIKPQTFNYRQHICVYAHWSNLVTIVLSLIYIFFMYISILFAHIVDSAICMWIKVISSGFLATTNLWARDVIPTVISSGRNMRPLCTSRHKDHYHDPRQGTRNLSRLYNMYIWTFNLISAMMGPLKVPKSGSYIYHTLRGCGTLRRGTRKLTPRYTCHAIISRQNCAELLTRCNSFTNKI